MFHVVFFGICIRLSYAYCILFNAFDFICTHRLNVYVFILYLVRNDWIKMINQYVGETSQMLSGRFSDHRSRIGNHNPTKIVQQKYGNFSWSVFWGTYNVLLLIMLGWRVLVLKPSGDILSPLGNFFYSPFQFYK